MSIVKITGDGNCFFRAISYLLYGGEFRHESIRKSVVEHITSNWSDYGDFIVGDESYGSSVSSVDEYRSVMIRDGQYGGIQEAVAVSQLYDVRILIYDAENITALPRIIGNSSVGRDLKLLFNGDRDSGHFDVLVAHHKF